MLWPKIYMDLVEIPLNFSSVRVWLKNLAQIHFCILLWRMLKSVKNYHVKLVWCLKKVRYFPTGTHKYHMVLRILSNIFN